MYHVDQSTAAAYQWGIYKETFIIHWKEQEGLVDVITSCLDFREIERRIWYLQVTHV